MIKRYHVYGLGNALVDFDVEVPTETLEQFNIEKGVMTLIDEERHHELMDHIDGKQHVKACGGSAANTIAAIAQLGGHCFYSCKVASDPSGDFYFQNLINQGIHTNLTADNREAGITGKCLVLITPDADRTMNTYLGITLNFSKKEINPHAIAQSDYLYIEGYLLAQPNAKEAILFSKEHAIKNDCKTTLTLSDITIVRHCKQSLLEVIGDGVDIIFCNEAEALLFCDTDDLQVACNKLQKHSEQFVITLGRNGSLVYDGHEYFELPATATTAIDTVGAGDMFAGAFLFGLTHGYSFPQSGELANFASGKVVNHLGPRLDQRGVEEIRKYLARL